MFCKHRFGHKFDYFDLGDLGYDVTSILTYDWMQYISHQVIFQHFNYVYLCLFMFIYVYLCLFKFI